MIPLPNNVMKKNIEQGSLAIKTCAIEMEEIMPLVREKLTMGGTATIPVRGVSMLPMLREGRDSVVLSPIGRELKKRDIVLYQRTDGNYILHRIADVGECYTCIGDAQFVFERGIAPSQMIAVVTEVRRGKRQISISHPLYRLYAVVWEVSRPARRFVIRVKRKLCRMLAGKK